MLNVQKTHRFVENAVNLYTANNIITKFTPLGIHKHNPIKDHQFFVDRSLNGFGLWQKKTKNWPITTLL